MSGPDGAGPEGAGPDGAGPNDAGPDARDEDGPDGDGRAAVPIAGLALALSMFSVAPVRARRTDRPAATVAIAVAPLVGAVVGAAVGGVVAGLLALGAPGLLAGVAGVVTGAALTRGLHLDGLADLADGLGSYGSPQRMLAVMKDPSTGAFGVIALVSVLVAQAAALPAVVGRGGVGVAAVALVWAAGRASFAWCARRGVPSASPGGLGALVAGTQPVAVGPVWALVLAAGAVVAVPGRPWQGPVAIAVAAVAVVALARHAVRRLGGVNGDVFGAVSETAVTVAIAVLALGS